MIKMMSSGSLRRFSSSAQRLGKNFKLVVVGGGAGGCSTAAKFAKKLGPGHVAIIEPADVHYYQPLWTLVGGGLKDLSQSAKPMSQVLPSKAEWIKDRAVKFYPDENKVVTEEGEEISYEYMVIAMGLQLRYESVPGLLEALETPGVGSNYSVKYVMKTKAAIDGFKSGENAVFTFPNTPIKCPGAPQKIMYIAEEEFKRKGKKGNFFYHTSLPVLFGCKKYADALWDECKERNISVTLRSHLVQVKPDSREAVFENLETKELTVLPYGLLHVCPPMGTPDPLKAATQLVDEAGFLKVDQQTLRHQHFPNIFGIGDCTSVVTARTAAAVAGQLKVLKKNLSDAMNNESPNLKYNGYTSCPLVVGKGKVILAEFDNQVPPQPLETFPIINQAKHLRGPFYFMKANILDKIYWEMLKGNWEGPSTMRKLMHLGMSK